MPLIAIGLFIMLNKQEFQSYEAAIKQSFETLQLYYLPFSGIENVREANVDYSFLTNKSLSHAFTCKHDLFTIDVPAGWKRTICSEDRLLNLAKEADQSCLFSISDITMVPFSKDDKSIAQDLYNGLKFFWPSVKIIGEPYSITIANGEKIVVQEFEGGLVESDKTNMVGAILAASKNSKRSLSFTGIYSSAIREEALTDIKAIFKSLR